jgi:mono/diheme cytochrome c family protein
VRLAPVTSAAFVAFVAFVALAGCKEGRENQFRLFGMIDAAPPPDAEPPPPPQAAPTLAHVEGADAAAGAKLYGERCASCHGADGRGKTEAAQALRLAPTDLTTTGYICRTTDARPITVPSDADVEGALERGSHRGRKELAALDPAARRSLTLHVKTLARDFDNPASPLAAIAPETPDDAAGRARGRTIYLTVGCWRCHGLDGAGGEAAALANIRWNERPIASLTPLAQRKDYLCGDAPEAVYRMISLGISARGAAIMPRYQEFLEDFARPWKVPPAAWTRSIDGKATPAEVAAIRAWLDSLPEHEAVLALKPSEKRVRAGAMLWDLVHYVRSM